MDIQLVSAVIKVCDFIFIMYAIIDEQSHGLTLKVLVTTIDALGHF